MALKISLKPGEKFVVNGAVIVNGDRRTSFIIKNKVSILRSRDIMTEDEVNTPCKRIYFPIMLSYLDQEGIAEYYEEFVQRMNDVMAVIENAEIKLLCVEISLAMMRQNYYRALTHCRKLLEYEATLLESADGNRCIS